MSKGRPSTQTPELIGQLLEALTRLGSTTKACETLGLKRKTLWSWRNRDPRLAAQILAAQSQYHLNKEFPE